MIATYIDLSVSYLCIYPKLIEVGTCKLEEVHVGCVCVSEVYPLKKIISRLFYPAS